MTSGHLSVPVSPHPLLFQRLRYHQFRNSARVLFQQSALRFFTILAVSLAVCGFVFGVSLAGFMELHAFRLAAMSSVIGTVFDLFFLTLMVMLLFSSGLILYSSLFASAEAAFLLHTPAPADQVFAYKFQGALAFSSWAFLLLGAPVLVAYGLVFGAPWPFYLLLPLFFFGFVWLPGSLGALVCLLVVNLVPRRRKQVVVAAILIVLTVAVLWTYQLFRKAIRPDMTNRDALHQLMGWFSFAQGPLIPSHWMTAGLQYAARGRYGTAGYYLGLVWSHGLLVYLFAGWAARRLYRRGYNRVATGSSLRKRYGGAWLDRLVTGSLRFLDPQMRLLIVKDFRTFRRDPAQWAQVLIFTGC